jgi:hypothetical protein
MLHTPLKRSTSDWATRQLEVCRTTEGGAENAVLEGAFWVRRFADLSNSSVSAFIEELQQTLPAEPDDLQVESERKEDTVVGARLVGKTITRDV